MSESHTPAPSHGVLTIPNVLTLLRLILIPFFLAASFRGRFREAFILFVAAALTDIIDGFVARRLNQRSRLGAVLDPTADKVMLVCGYLFYTLSPVVPFRLPYWVTYVIFARDVLIVAFAYLLYTRIQIRRFPPSLAGKLSTLCQAVTLAAVIGVNSVTPGLATFAAVMFRVALVMTLLSGLDYLRRANLLLEGIEN
jgi:cardiolipin synthase (CMP-forming)